MGRISFASSGNYEISTPAQVLESETKKAVDVRHISCLNTLEMGLLDLLEQSRQENRPRLDGRALEVANWNSLHRKIVAIQSNWHGPTTISPVGQTDSS